MPTSSQGYTPVVITFNSHLTEGEYNLNQLIKSFDVLLLQCLDTMSVTESSLNATNQITSPKQSKMLNFSRLQEIYRVHTKSFLEIRLAIWIFKVSHYKRLI
jgi:hypothetical protein